MINASHAILYGDDAEATRAALATVLMTRTADAGSGWLIFALPPAELAVHPVEEAAAPNCTCSATTSPPPWPPLRAEGIEVRPISDQGWGLLTPIALPGGVELGLYQPRHPTAAQSS
jgi:hypothetical protein